jgi:hypothetical protein
MRDKMADEMGDEMAGKHGKLRRGQVSDSGQKWRMRGSATCSSAMLLFTVGAMFLLLLPTASLIILPANPTITIPTPASTYCSSSRFSKAGESWYNTSWGYRRAITISGSTSNLTDYQVKVTNPIYDETGLVGSWHFEEAAGTVSGTTADSSGSGNNGILTNMASPYGIVATGKYDNGMSFDGVDDYVQKTSPTGLSTGNAPRTIVAWSEILPAVNGWASYVDTLNLSKDACAIA